MRFLIALLLIIVAFASNTFALQCEMCQYAIKAAEDLVDQNFTQNQILPYLNSACNLLPESWAAPCEIVVEQYGWQFIQKAIAHETPEVACTQLGLCVEVEAEVEVEEQEAPVQTNMLGKWHWKKHHKNPFKHLEKELKCKACHYVVGKADGYINREFNEAKHAIDRECDVFELHPAVKYCKHIVDHELDKIFNEVRRHESPANVCKHIHWC
ncbi:hypothetical protein DICPUDRAFT_90392 [Dictyostelium purpureum]|uniref:Saposin B-type domain-containing protein n=1 Tax=Dictyostelium purpureum TaxID=5786 RepID=F1A284_DICPU|nr:uncharacterized protein DICPUDRAFT_90392 [Dictyostelium purpureum]EGC29695.1 hypothetical protein DICPUDRAFT_90392 [Dictyostelium purpureum]|eukprot:XP_003293777.1 hypothetical protein DICPUDRAFT_90392 [Dictyostelium purpureum]